MKRFVPAWISALAAALSILIGSGCAATSQRGFSTDSSDSIPVDTAMNGKELLSEYASASGKLCRRYKNTAETELVVRCLSDSGQWQSVKPLSGIYSNSRLASLMLEASRNRTESDGSQAALVRADTLEAREHTEYVTHGANDAPLASSDHGFESDTGDDVDALVLASGQHTGNDAPDAGDPATVVVEFQVGEGESLWSLSERATGSGTHWIEIARFNNLEDGNNVASGQRILVPQALLR